MEGTWLKPAIFWVKIRSRLGNCQLLRYLVEFLLQNLKELYPRACEMLLMHLFLITQTSLTLLWPTLGSVFLQFFCPFMQTAGSSGQQCCTMAQKKMSSQFLTSRTMSRMQMSSCSLRQQSSRKCLGMNAAPGYAIVKQRAPACPWYMNQMPLLGSNPQALTSLVVMAPSEDCLLTQLQRASVALKVSQSTIMSSSREYSSLALLCFVSRYRWSIVLKVVLQKQTGIFQCYFLFMTEVSSGASSLFHTILISEMKSVQHSVSVQRYRYFSRTEKSPFREWVTVSRPKLDDSMATFKPVGSKSQLQKTARPLSTLDNDLYFISRLKTQVAKGVLTEMAIKINLEQELDINQYLYHINQMTLSLSQHDHIHLRGPCQNESRGASPKLLVLPGNQLNPEDQKQKVQLCRQFMEFGECPYEGRCKFAHGSHQLLKNQQVNHKYKTKRCENFERRWSCLYGNRCNFIHGPRTSGGVRQPCDMSVEWSLLWKGCRPRSRLLQLVGGDRV